MDPSLNGCGDVGLRDAFSSPQEHEEFNDTCSENTRFSLESQDFDSNHGTVSSETTETIYTNFQDMGIDANWHNEPTVPTPLPSSELPMLLPATSSSETNYEASSSDTHMPSPSNNSMQLVLYVPPDTPNQESKDSKALPGSCGLVNLGNTCFMNAGLQCLTATRALVRFFVTDSVLLGPSEQQRQNEASGGFPSVISPAGDFSSLTQVFSQLLAKMWAGKFANFSPSEFKKCLGLRHPQFKDCRQHDCQEFLALLLDTLHEQLNTASGKEVPMSTPPPEIPCKAKEDAKPGCSKQEHFEQSPNTLTLSPNRSNNLEVAKQLAKRETERVEKNHVEQSRSPQLCVTSPQHVNDSAVLGGLHIEDILKEAKTSNVNVLAPHHRQETRPNNQIKFDSEKFGSSRLSLSPAASVPRGGICNFVLANTTIVENPTHMNDDCGVLSGKPQSESLHEPLHKKLKQTNLQQAASDSSACASATSEPYEEREAEGNMYKKIKLIASVIKNKVEMSEQTDSRELENGTGSSEEDESEDLDQQEAAKAHWDQHLSTNQSVIADTFQGQFRSTVVCSSCSHKSVTFEPFMYLSVPLPHAMELQLEVTLVCADPSTAAVRFLVSVHRTATVETLKEEVRKLSGTSLETSDLAVCECMENRVSKVLHPYDHIEKSPRDRAIYVIEIPKMDWHAPEPLCDLNEDPPDLEEMESYPVENAPFIPPDRLCFPMHFPSLPIEGPFLPMQGPCLPMQGPSPCDESIPWPKCSICLEEVELNKGPLKHGNNCECVLCADCLQACKVHQNSPDDPQLRCPVCHRIVDPDIDFVVMTSINSKCKPSPWLMSVPVVFRVDDEGEEYNNRRTASLYGHPRLLNLPCKVNGSELYEAIRPYAPCQDFTLLHVSGNGLMCSSCLYHSHCKGCPIKNCTSETIEFQANAMIAVRTSQLPIGWPLPTIDHESMQQERNSDILSLYECLGAFTKPETLDEDNPWFCPNCKKNQCATKTISVWRYPPVLIVYLKRFIFHEGRSIKLDNKVAFPLDKLYLREAAGKRRRETQNFYDLYSCVCHMGVSGHTGSGHYLAYSKHPSSSEWFRYNDETVSRQRPQEEDYSQAYVLFYQQANGQEPHV